MTKKFKKKQKKGGQEPTSPRNIVIRGGRVNQEHSSHEYQRGEKGGGFPKKRKRAIIGKLHGDKKTGKNQSDKNKRKRKEGEEGGLSNVWRKDKKGLIASRGGKGRDEKGNRRKEVESVASSTVPREGGIKRGKVMGHPWWIQG